MKNSAMPGLQISAQKVTSNSLIDHSPDEFLQQAFWAEHKTDFGWQELSIEIQAVYQGNNLPKTVFLALSRHLAWGFSFLYLPHAPNQNWIADLVSKTGLSEAQLLTAISQATRRLAAKRCVFIRFDLAWQIGSQSCRPELDSEANLVFSGEILRAKLNYHPLRKASADIQPPDTVILDLHSGSEAVLAGMKPKTRYNIRLAEKKGVRVVTAGLEKFDAWYDLYRITAERDQIAVHSARYYRTLLERNPQGMDLLLAYHEDDLLAGTIMMYCGRTATYLYGASSNIKRQLMPAYALQWAGIQSALNRSCRFYDFGGVPPDNAPTHPMHGLFQFKTGFGGNLISMPGCWDMPFLPLTYNLLRLAETARQVYFKKLKKRRS